MSPRKRVRSRFQLEIIMKQTASLSAVRLLAMTGLIVMGSGNLQAQSPVTTLVVPFPAGGPSDFVARTIQPELSQHLGETIIIDNVGGVGGTLGIRRALGAAADGHTMVLASPNELILTPLAVQAARHKPEEMRPIAFVVSGPVALLARKDLPASNFEDLLAQARKPSAKDLTYGSIGIGSLYHLVAEDFAQRAGLALVHVPYKGAAPMLADLMGGQIDIAFMALGGNVPALIREGKLRAYGVARRQPAAQMPELPTLANVKGFETFEFEAWVGLFVARGTPDAVVNKLNQAANIGLKASEYRKTFEARGSTVYAPMTPEALDRVYTSEIAKYQALAKAINIQPQ
jgi:tripartite-type tricarboxylate transporter receptor subunit TctC